MLYESNEALEMLFGYTGQQFDTTTGLQNNLNRWYDPNVGRWISEDPIGFAAGDSNLYRYVSNSPTNFTDPSGLAKFRADMVAKSFINGVPNIGTITPDRPGIGPSPDWLYVPTGVPLVSATDRLKVLALGVGKLPAFNQNPQTDAKDQTYRLYTRIDVTFNCCGNNVTGFSFSTDKDGGRELGPVYGKINLDGGPGLPNPTVRLTGAGILVVSWRGWGRPHRLVEPGMQWVATRSSVNIWHQTEVWLECKNGKGTFSIVAFDGSRFPSHRLWVNGQLKRGITQGAFGELWNPMPGSPTFVR